MHSTVSDGTDSPEELLSRVKEEGIDLFALTDHDAVKGSKMLREILGDSSPRIITGAEFSTKDEVGKYHILGYDFDPDAKSVQDIMEQGHAYGVSKVKGMLELLEKDYGYVFSEEDVKELFEQDNPGKPHVANLLLKYGYVSSRAEVFNNILKHTGYMARFLRPEDAIDAIILAGGIPVLAHPYYGSGDQLIVGDDMDERLRRLIGFGLQGVEAFYSGFSVKFIKDMLSMAEKYSLYITAGSDYHGTNKLVQLGDTGFDPGYEMPEGMVRFIRAAVRE